jgi:hypothetical protein
MRWNLKPEVMKMNESFCVFVISHGRPDNVITLRTLNRCGYTGPLFIVCDNEDKTIDQYRKNYGAGMVLVFDKPHYALLVDSCDNFQNRSTTTHARNACFDLAKERGFEYFLVLDDDYTDFRYSFDRKGEFVRQRVGSAMDTVMRAYSEFMDADERIDSICFMQTGDLLGGDKSSTLKGRHFPWKKRKAMNSFFCKTSRRFWFFSRLNEDVNTYMTLGNRGRIFLTIPDVYLQQKQTQSTGGGMSIAYLAGGTYVKSFYTVMIGPSYCVATVTASMQRIHHKISWNNAVPKILDECHKKGGSTPTSPIHNQEK